MTKPKRVVEGVAERTPLDRAGKRVRITVEDPDAPQNTPKRRAHRGTVNISRDEMGCAVEVYLDTPIGLVSALEPFMSFEGKRVELIVRLIDEDGGANG